ncbi:unnamed protein product [Caenorhabditis auriculariae]|uniref:Uncharacterized protein n=1 Tax=Caenorhabditis auriculariae TaxID=2777116 RepID=A0A8S1HYV8_9PELO|nr:unnamed protein product [Caenorhabditis auriculariae]
MISRQTWNIIGSPALEPTPLSLKTADGSPMTVQGRFNAKFNIFDARHRSTTGSGPCYVTEKTHLLGLDWLIAIPQYRHLRKELSCRMTTTCQNREETVAKLRQKYASVFEEGLGRCTKTKAKLFLKPESRPVYIKKRPLPYASQPAIDAEIDRLVNEGVLSSIDYSQWAAPIVAVKEKPTEPSECVLTSRLDSTTR